MKFKKILVWFRNDLRLHDNEMLVEAIAKSDCILPVYFFDPRYFGQPADGTEQTSTVKAQFLLESVQALRTSFERFGGNLMVIQGEPEANLVRLVEEFEISEVYHHREVAAKETQISAHAEDVLWKVKINLKHFIGHTLYNKEDLPFPIKDIPNVFVQFKKKTERDAIVKACFEVPEEIKFVESSDWGTMPNLEDLGAAGADLPADRVKGGEIEGLKHLEALLQEGATTHVKKAKAAVSQPGFTSRLSPWLALGCLSPRKVYWQVKAAEAKYGANPNFNQLILGLLWRDYFRFMFKKHGQLASEVELNKADVSALAKQEEVQQYFKTELEHWGS